ncbi:uncharacterized protein K452DRAFT_289425 [Aplosporella prunicola CBS 121167]|uniref:Uncharacterized protein n=1 Tax=Aplosporella prunicola CBS 121167 TaxID=1176127 RepID=A0A6A6B7D0_9PEZI|nr:uncharacterized protein K452DRAFT_289425 [Aplosporella prunicola CBS 121167]KAF2140029.1 hypothetical protein K452DRAFT_289425 [Aplosporella prunicola CBS 121167]
MTPGIFPVLCTLGTSPTTSPQIVTRYLRYESIPLTLLYPPITPCVRERLSDRNSPSRGPHGHPIKSSCEQKAEK